ncbi:MAG: hypothetical protein PHH49_07835 [Candidatus Omnitrophica bacterium]|nr:hypothetical protein [Candidatus Omnitrophota bacterium]MDD5488847.1 hypothetical protein [Candidatus Omnitrophota bacterium]
MVKRSLLALFLLNLLVTLSMAADKKDEERVIALVIETENNQMVPVSKPVKYYLPEEIIPRHIIDNGGFEVLHDQEYDQFYLFREERYAPEEKKEFKVTVRDVWNVSLDIIERYRKEAEGITEFLKDTSYHNAAEVLYRAIERNSENIIISQKRSQSIKDHIAQYRVNAGRLETVEEDLDKLRELRKKRKFRGAENAGKNLFWKIVILVSVWSSFIGILTLMVMRKKRSDRAREGTKGRG